MAGSVNKVILIGNLGADPESRTMQNGNTVVSFSVATSESWNDKQSGERRERVEWHKVVVFNDALADIATRFLRKGSKVYIEGQLQTRKWADQQGQDKYTTEVVLPRYNGGLTLLGDPRGGEQAEREKAPAAGRSTPARQERAFAGAATGGGWAGGSDLDDAIPFGAAVL